MNILIVLPAELPAKLYGGTERVVWCLAKSLAELGHNVFLLAKGGSICSFAQVIPINENKKIIDQIPEYIDVVHFHIFPENIEECKKPYIITMHGNTNNTEEIFDVNTVFVSKNHAERHGSEVFVHNGLDWSFYTKPDLNTKRSYYHFLAKAAWRVKNVKGAIACIKKTRSERLKVLGGVRFNFNMGVRLTFSPRVRFYGMVGGEEKDLLLNGSKGLIFPVRWNEPFGLAIIESLYYGCPVFGTPYGSLPEIVNDQVGFLSDQSELIAVQLENNQYNRRLCHEYASDAFNSKKMANSYLALYEKVLSGQQLNRDFPKLKEKQQEKFLPWS